MQRRLGCICVLLAFGVPSSALACSLASPLPHAIDPDEVALDHTPPTPPTGLTVRRIRRGTGPRCDARGVCVSTSCDDIGQVELTWNDGVDDRTGPGLLGVIVRVVDGDAPAFALLDTAFWPLEDGVHLLMWDDGAVDEQEPIEVQIELSHVDLAGNESEPVTLWITHDGGLEVASRTETGCSNTGAVSRVGSLFFWLGLWAMARRVEGAF